MAADKADKEVQVRLLVDSALGKCNDVVTLDKASAAAAVKSGDADDNADAVAYALSLVPPKAE
jgi:hypothetical protein